MHVIKCAALFLRPKRKMHVESHRKWKIYSTLSILIRFPFIRSKITIWMLHSTSHFISSPFFASFIRNITKKQIYLPLVHGKFVQARGEKRLVTHVERLYRQAFALMTVIVWRWWYDRSVINIALRSYNAIVNQAVCVCVCLCERQTRKKLCIFGN